MKNKKDTANILRCVLALPTLSAGVKATKFVMKALGVRRGLGVRLIELSVGIAVANFTDKHAGNVISAVACTIYDHFFEKKGDDLISKEDKEFFDREEVREDMKVKVKMMKEEKNG